jgi:hypothetical protein
MIGQILRVQSDLEGSKQAFAAGPRIKAEEGGRTRRDAAPKEIDYCVRVCTPTSWLDTGTPRLTFTRITASSGMTSAPVRRAFFNN